MNTELDKAIEALERIKTRILQLGSHPGLLEPEIAHAVCVEIPDDIEQALVPLSALRDKPGVDLMEVLQQCADALGKDRVYVDILARMGAKSPHDVDPKMREALEETWAALSRLRELGITPNTKK